jgi:hypothetical protein
MRRLWGGTKAEFYIIPKIDAFYWKSNFLSLIKVSLPGTWIVAVAPANLPSPIELMHQPANKARPQYRNTTNRINQKSGSQLITSYILQSKKEAPPFTPQPVKIIVLKQSPSLIESSSFGLSHSACCALDCGYSSIKVVQL